MSNVTFEAAFRQLINSGRWFAIDDLAGAVQPQLSRRQILRNLELTVGDLTGDLNEVLDAEGRHLNPLALPQFISWLKGKRFRTRVLQIFEQLGLVTLTDARGHSLLRGVGEITAQSLDQALSETADQFAIVPHLDAHRILRNRTQLAGREILDCCHYPLAFEPPPTANMPTTIEPHIKALESESIAIFREAVASASNPAMLFSMGKDSMVMLRLAEKAFAPEPIPFPLVMIDTRWKFREMYRFRAWLESRSDLRVMVHINPEAIEQDVNPFDFGSARHTEITKTDALKQILDEHRFDFVFGGARRDEEKSRAKERIFSIRNQAHGWDPRNQRPEFWDSYNTVLVDGQSMRVFPISNWTELDIWRYIHSESIPLVPLYLSKRRPFVDREGNLLMVDDERFRLREGEKIKFEPIRFRTLGCYPLTGGMRSDALTTADILAELEAANDSERSSRVIDFDRGASMEQKKRDGYF
jgi:sulfate adenylyltransferase subunit 2